MTDHLAAIRAGVDAAIARHRARGSIYGAAIATWARKRDAYLDAARVLTPCDPIYRRAKLLAEAAGYRLLAWHALANGDAHQAAHMRRRGAAAMRAATGRAVPHA